MKLCVIGRGEDGSFVLILLQMSIEMSNYNFYYQLVYEYKYFLKNPSKDTVRVKAYFAYCLNY